MDSRRWLRLSALFDQACELAADQRDDFIAERCAGDEELAAELRRLLAADSDAGADAFLQSPLTPPDVAEWQPQISATAAQYDSGSRQFGPYKLLRLIGQGGMGEVHLAERSDGAFEQRVALKLLPHPTPGLIQRFRQERQILARLEHPNIARLLDGGVGEQNIPYFAMEYVEGEPVTNYVAGQKASITATLQLFLQVCEAIQYAHRNLVVHRDIKPSNVLVTNDGVPKLLDFGIAKILEITDADERTHTAMRMFTPDYAAPEQIRGDPITTATDVYALGVVLYELLTGARPYKLVRGKSLEQAILDTQPVAPSLAVQKTTGNTTQRSRSLRGDLDRIVLTALAKEPERRYSSAEMLAVDIRHYLDGRPIAARGDSTTYRMRKFIKRNKAAIAATIVVALSLLIGSGLALWQAQQARLQAQRAENKTRTSEAVRDYMLSVFTSANPYKVSDHVVSARELLEDGMHQVSSKLADQPQVQGELDQVFGDTFMQLGQRLLAQEGYRAALAAYRKVQTDDSREVLDVELNLANIDMMDTQPADLQQRLERIAKAAITQGESTRQIRWGALEVLSGMQRMKGDYAAADRVVDELLAFSRSEFGAENENTAYALYDLVILRLLEARFGQATDSMRTLFAITQKTFEPTHPFIQYNAGIIGRLTGMLGNYPAASRLLLQTASVMQSQVGPANTYVIVLKQEASRYEVRIDDSVASRQRVLDLEALFSAKEKKATRDAAELRYASAEALLDVGDIERADGLITRALADVQTLNNADSPTGLAVAAMQARLALARGDSAQALSLLAPILPLQRTRGDRELPASLITFIGAMRAQKHEHEADQAVDELITVLQRQDRPEHPYAAFAHDEYSRQAERSGDLAAAQIHARLAAVTSLRAFGPSATRSVMAIDRLHALQVKNHQSATPLAELVRDANAIADPVAELAKQASRVLETVQKKFSQGPAT